MIVIMGMRRSGTSLMAQLLADAGLKIENSLPVDVHNQLGYFEDFDVMIKNDRILNFNGGTWDNPPDVMNGLYQWNNDCDAVKDPRFCLTYPAWQFPPDTKFIKVKRKEHAVVKSLMRRGTGKRHAQRLYRHYNKLMDSYECNSFSISYEELIKGVFRKLNNFVGVKLNKKVIRRDMNHG